MADYLKTIFISFYILSLLINVYLIFLGVSQTAALNNCWSIERKCELYDGIQYINKTIAEGLYWVGQNYYCVWAEGRSLNQIQEVEYHEHCHYLVDNDYEHFCK